MRTREETRDRLNAVFQDVFDDPGIAIFDAMTAQDYEDWDSFAHITLILAVEKEFGLKLNASEIGNLQDVGAMIALLQERATL